MRFKIFLILFAMFLTVNGAFASKLPDSVWNFMKAQFPNSTQRFDSVLTIKKDVMYIPLYPAQENDVKTLEVEYTYPQNSSLSSLPEVIILNNNFVFLKLYKDKTGNFTVVNNENLPMKVKLGVMPQDMLVPAGMKIPENLKIVLGNLSIPSVEEGSLAINKDGVETKIKPLEGQVAREFLSNEESFYALNEMKGRKAYVTSNDSKFVVVYDETSANPLYELKLMALPLKISASNTSKLAMALYFRNKKAEIIDLQNERVLSQIEFEEEPKDVVIDEKQNIAYVSVPAANSVYVVDLGTSNVKKIIKTTQMPCKLALNNTNTSLAFTDWATQELYVMEFLDEFSTRKLAQTNNVSELIYDNDSVFAISRTRDKIIEYDHIRGNIKSEVKLHKKPTDAILKDGKVFVLCADDNVIDIYDIALRKVVRAIGLDNQGFYSKITTVPNTSNVIITGFSSGKFIVFDLESEQIVKKQPFELEVSNLIIIDK